MNSHKTTKKADPLFSKEFIAKIKKLLLAEKEQLENDLLKFAKKDSEAPGGYASSFPDYGDKDDENAAEVADYQVRLSLEDTLEKSLRDVKKALKQIENGIYGVCKYCGKQIETKRLEIRPSSASCASCKKAIQSS